MLSIVQFKTAKPDINGNSRRVFVAIDNGLLIGAWRDDGRGISSIPYMHLREMYKGLTFLTTPAQIKSLVKHGESLLYSA